MTVYPGEGVIMSSASAFTQKCVGRVRQNCVNKDISSAQAIHSSLIALAGSVDETLRFPNAHGDTISRMTGTDGSYTTQLLATSDWQTLGTVTLTNTAVSWVDLASTNKPQRFYRAVLAP